MISIISKPSGSMMLATITKLISFGISTLIILSILPVDQVAFWFLISSISAFAGVLDIGLSPTFIRFFSYFSADGNTQNTIINTKIDNKNQLLFSEVVLFIPISIIIYLYLFIVEIYVVKINFFNENATVDFQNVWSWFKWYLPIIFILKPFDSYLKGTGKLPLAYHIDAFGHLAFLASMLILISSEQTITVIIYAFLFSNLLAAFLKFSVCIKEVSFEDFRDRLIISKENQKKIFRASLLTGLIVAFSQSTTYLLNIIISANLTTEQIASYLMGIRFIQICAELSYPFFYSKIPQFNKLRIKNDTENLTKNSLSSLQKSLHTFLVISLFVGFASSFFLDFVESETAFVSSLAWSLMVIIWFFDRHQAMHAQIYMTSNKIPFTSNYLISSILTITLTLLLIDSLGYMAALASLFVSKIFINTPFITYKSLKSLKVSWFDYFRNISVSIIMLGAIIVINQVSLVI